MGRVLGPLGSDFGIKGVFGTGEVGLFQIWSSFEKNFENKKVFFLDMFFLFVFCWKKKFYTKNKL